MRGFCYGFEYSNGRGVTQGAPNSRTGKFSISGTPRAFRNTRDLHRWIDAASAGVERMAVSAAKLRQLRAGLTVAEFGEECRRIMFEADQVPLFDD